MSRRYGGGAPGVAAILGCSACWGIGSVFTKSILSRAEPVPVLLVQLASSGAFLWIVALVTGRAADARKLGLRRSMPGLLDPGLSYILGTAGLALTTASSASLITSMQPIGVIFLAFAVLGERVAKRAFYGSALAIVGLALFSGARFESGGAIGDVLVLLSTLSASAYCLLTRGFAERVDPLAVAAAHQTGGLALIALFAAASGTFALPGESWLLIGEAALIGILQYAMSLWLYFVSLRRLDLHTAALFLISIPLFSIAASAAVLGEAMCGGQYLGALVVLAALGIACGPIGEAEGSLPMAEEPSL